MRRKSERNKNKSSPDKKIAETPPQPVRKSKRHSRKQRSPSHEDSDDDAMKTGKSPQHITPSKSPSNSDDEIVEKPIWKVQTADSASGEIQKIKICLTRPTPTTPERREKSPRRKRHKSATNHEGDGEERSSRKSRRRGSSAVANLEDSLSNSNSQESQEDEGKFNKDKAEAHEILEESVHDTSEPVQAQIINQNEPKMDENVEQMDTSEEAKSRSGSAEGEPEMEVEMVKEPSASPKTIEDLPKIDQKEEKAAIISKEIETVAVETIADKTIAETVAVETIADKTIAETVADETIADKTVAEETIADKTVAEETIAESVAEESPEAPEVPQKALSVEEEAEITQSVAAISQIAEIREAAAPEAPISVEKASEVACIVSEKPQEVEEPNVSQREEDVTKAAVVEAEPEKIIKSPEITPEKKKSVVIIAPETSSSEKEQCKASRSKKTIRIALDEEKQQCELVNRKIEPEVEEEPVADDWEVVQKEEIEEIVRLESEATKKRLLQEKSEQKQAKQKEKKRRTSDDSESTGSSSESSDDCNRRKPKTITAKPEIKTTPQVETEPEPKPDTKQHQETPKPQPEVKETIAEITETNKTCVEQQTNAEPKPERRKRKWTIPATCSAFLTSVVTSETIRDICPHVEILQEDQVRLEIKPDRWEKKAMDRKVSVEQKEDLDDQNKHESEDISSANVISMNRKISIVDDEAAKLQPPPQPAKNPVSGVLYITNLVRPFTLKQLKELLSRTGNIAENGFWTDKIKSKCYVQYENEE